MFQQRQTLSVGFGAGGDADVHPFGFFHFVVVDLREDQLIFPEIDYNKVEKVKGLNISITTTARTDAEGLALLRHLGMPFRQ